MRGGRCSLCVPADAAIPTTEGWGQKRSTFRTSVLPATRSHTTQIHTMINELVSKMVEAGVHYGHQTRKWHPNMKKYILTQKNGIHIINLEETEKCLDKACAFLAEKAAKNKKILFVGCKRQAQEAVKEAAEATGQYYVNFRWLGGMLTNMATIKKSIARLDWLENLDKQPDYVLIKCGSQHHINH